MHETFLDGRTAVVTGATRGIGFAIARTLADAGATVAICGRSQAGVDDAVSRLTNDSRRKVVGKAADVRASTEVAALFAWVESEAGGPDILVNNAGVGLMKSVAELTVQDWQQTIETNLSGAFYCSREALARFKNRGRRLHHQYRQPGRKECICGRRRLQRFEVRIDRIHRSHDAGFALRQRPGVSHYAGKRRYRI